MVSIVDGAAETTEDASITGTVGQKHQKYFDKYKREGIRGMCYDEWLMLAMDNMENGTIIDESTFTTLEGCKLTNSSLVANANFSDFRFLLDWDRPADVYSFLRSRRAVRVKYS